MKRIPTFEEAFNLQSAADEAGRDFWFNNVVFSNQWWLLVVVTIAPYIVWWKIVDRRRFFEIITYGLLVALFAGLLDAIGVETDAWEYKYDLIPLLDVFITYDITVLPVSYMLIYQYFPKWQSFAIAHIVISFLFAFVAEPLLIWLDVYQLIAWKHIYSVPGYFFLAIFLRWVMGRMIKKSQSR
jgi:hypothetical protein